MAQVFLFFAALLFAVAAYFGYKACQNKRFILRKDAKIARLQEQLRQEKQRSTQLQQQIDNMLKTGYAEHGYSGH